MHCFSISVQCFSFMECWIFCTEFWQLHFFIKALYMVKLITLAGNCDNLVFNYHCWGRQPLSMNQWNVKNPLHIHIQYCFVNKMRVRRWTCWTGGRGSRTCRWYGCSSCSDVRPGTWYGWVQHVLDDGY